MPLAGTNLSRAASVQLLLMLSVDEYRPMGQRLQACSSGIIQVPTLLPSRMLPPWTLPYLNNNGKASNFKWDPALQQKTRERFACAFSNRLFLLCQWVEHSSWLNASAKLKAARESATKKERTTQNNNKSTIPKHEKTERVRIDQMKLELFVLKNTTRKAWQTERKRNYTYCFPY